MDNAKIRDGKLYIDTIDLKLKKICLLLILYGRKERG